LRVRHLFVHFFVWPFPTRHFFFPGRSRLFRARLIFFFSFPLCWGGGVVFFWSLRKDPFVFSLWEVFLPRVYSRKWGRSTPLFFFPPGPAAFFPEPGPRGFAFFCEVFPNCRKPAFLVAFSWVFTSGYNCSPCPNPWAFSLPYPDLYFFKMIYVVPPPSRKYLGSRLNGTNVAVRYPFPFVSLSPC